MPITTSKTALLFSTDGTTYKKYTCIKDYPEQAGNPDTIEVTTLCSSAKEYIEGLGGAESGDFTANYDLDEYKALKALEKQNLHICLSFGENGEYGQFVGRGSIKVNYSAGAVNAVREMTIHVTWLEQLELYEGQTPITPTP